MPCTESCPAVLLHLSTVATVTLGLPLHHADTALAEMRWSVQKEKENRCSPISGECKCCEAWRDGKDSSCWTQSLQQPSPRWFVALNAKYLHTNQIGYVTALLETTGGISALYQKEKHEWHSAHFLLGDNVANSSSSNT